MIIKPDLTVKMTFCENITTVKWPKVIIIMKNVHFKDNTSKTGIQSSYKKWNKVF